MRLFHWFGDLLLAVSRKHIDRGSQRDGLVPDDKRAVDSWKGASLENRVESGQARTLASVMTSHRSRGWERLTVKGRSRGQLPVTLVCKLPRRRLGRLAAP
jgi:hypothetical protein